MGEDNLFLNSYLQYCILQFCIFLHKENGGHYLFAKRESQKFSHEVNKGYLKSFSNTPVPVQILSLSNVGRETDLD